MICETVEELTPIIGTRPACRALGAASATIYRRRRPLEPRPPRPRPTPARALSAQEREQVLALLHSERFVDSSPAQVWATLLDEGRYLASERTMYRLWPRTTAGSGSGATSSPIPATRGRSCSPSSRMSCGRGTSPSSRARRSGPSFYLYVILDVFSRYVVGWTVQYRETGQLATALIGQSVEQQQIARAQLTVHADRGIPMRCKPVAFLMADLGVTKSHSRPYTSTDNPYSEAQFKTLKYRPEFPDRFDSIEQAREFCRGFFHWYNHQHRHSGIGLMTPAAVHYGQAQQLHAARACVLDAAYARNPERFVRRAPVPPELPTAAWINKPDMKEVAH